MSQPTSSVILFDLDGVLTTRDTMAALIMQRLKWKPFRLLTVLPIYAVAVIAGSHRELAARANRLAVQVTFKGLNVLEYRALASGVGRRLAAQPGFIREDLVQHCRDIRGVFRVVIVTASELYLAESLLEAIGLPDVEVIASRLTFVDGVPRVVLHNVGSQKVLSLEAAGIPLEFATFYTDSASDLPLAFRAARTVIVHPTRRARRRLLGAFPGAQLIE